jgi:hypothetical protein
MAVPPRVIVSTTSKYELEYKDEGSGADMDGAFYRPQTTTAFYIVGGYAQGNYSTPIGPSYIVMVEDDDPSSPVLKAPVDYDLIWADNGSGADMDGSIWHPRPPDGYVTIGYVAQTGHSKPSISNFRCIRQDIASSGKIGQLIWWDKGSGADNDLASYAILDSKGNNTGFYYAQPNYNAPQGSVWTLEEVLASQ